jgi:Thymosin beta-4 family
MEKASSIVVGIEGFDSTKLRHTETQEKNPLPDRDGESKRFHFTLKCFAIFLTLMHDQQLHDLTKFPRFLHVFKAVAAEKTHIEFISGVEQFDKTSMKHAETTEKNPLPPIEGTF